MPKNNETKKPKKPTSKAKKGVVVTMRKTKKGVSIRATSYDGTDLRDVFPGLLR